MSKLKPTKAEQTKIFNAGYGQIRMYVIASFGMTTEYIKNPKMSVSQQKKAPTHTIEATEDMRKKAIDNKKKYEAKQAKEISILEYATKVAKANKGKITHKSKSGSVYLLVRRKTVRISDHFILDRDAMNPKERHDYEIVQRSFTNNDGVVLDFK
jgi:hypothetical protein